jgi:hypothetical protein
MAGPTALELMAQNMAEAAGDRKTEREKGREAIR